MRSLRRSKHAASSAPERNAPDPLDSEASDSPRSSWPAPGATDAGARSDDARTAAAPSPPAEAPSTRRRWPRVSLCCTPSRCVRPRGRRASRARAQPCARSGCPLACTPRSVRVRSDSTDRRFVLTSLLTSLFARSVRVRSDSTDRRFVVATGRVAQDAHAAGSGLGRPSPAQLPLPGPSADRPTRTGGAAGSRAVAPRSLFYQWPVVVELPRPSGANQRHNVHVGMHVRLACSWKGERTWSVARPPSDALHTPARFAASAPARSPRAADSERLRTSAPNKPSARHAAYGEGAAVQRPASTERAPRCASRCSMRARAGPQPPVGATRDRVELSQMARWQGGRGGGVQVADEADWLAGEGDAGGA